MPSTAGQGSGDFRETSARVQPFHVGFRNSMGIATTDAYTQANPCIVTTTANISTTLTGLTSKRGILGCSIAFTRPDIGNGYHGGPVQVGSAYVVGQKPLGIFINDALGNSYENQPGVGSGHLPYFSGLGTLGVSLWESQQQISASTTLTYTAGNLLYASVNGLLTNRIQDAYQYNVSGQNDPDFVTVMGVVKTAADASNTFMIIDLRV